LRNKIDFFLIPFAFDGCIAASGIVVNLFAQDLGATPFQLGLLGFAWGLSYAVWCVLSGRLADRWPRRGLLMGGISLFTLSLWLNQFCQAPAQLIWIAALTGTGCAFFWPAFETLLRHGDPARTRTQMALFNVGWTSGIAAGLAAGGYLSEWGTLPALQLIAGLGFADLLYLLWTTRGGIPAVVSPAEAEAMTEGAPVPSVRTRRTFLYLAWTANFGLWFAGGATSSLFPKLARELRFPDGDIGVLLSLVTVAQGITFLVPGRTARWHYRAGPLFAAQGVTLLGLMALTWFSTKMGLGLGLVGLGLARGFTYSSSLYYGLHTTAAQGLLIGLHEMIIGAAFTSGPLGAGLAADHFSLRAPYPLSAIVILLGLVVQGSLWWGLQGQERRGEQGEDSQGGE